jgi:hypothetical protein
MCRSAPGLLLIAVLPLAAQMDLPLMPWPAKVVRGSGNLAIDAVSVRADRSGGRRTTGCAAQWDGCSPRWVSKSLARRPTSVIEVERPKPGVQQYGDDESYRLTVTPQSARLTALEPLGHFGDSKHFCNSPSTGPSPPSISPTSLASVGAACRLTSHVISFRSPQ